MSSSKQAESQSSQKVQPQLTATVSSDEFVTILEKKISKRKRAQSVDLTTVVCDEDNDDVTILHEHNMTRVPSKRKKRRIVIDLANNKDDMNGIISIVQVIPPPDPLIVAKALENAARRDRVPNPCFRAHKRKCIYGAQCRFSHDVVPIPYCRAYNDTGECHQVGCKRLHRLYNYVLPLPPVMRRRDRLFLEELQFQQPQQTQQAPNQPHQQQSRQAPPPDQQAAHQRASYQYERATSAYTATSSSNTYTQVHQHQQQTFTSYGRGCGGEGSRLAAAFDAEDAARNRAIISQQLPGPSSQRFPPLLQSSRSSPLRDPRLLSRSSPGFRHTATPQQPALGLFNTPAENSSRYTWRR